MLSPNEVTAGAITIETIADQQLVAFAKVKRPGAIIKTGLWAALDANYWYGGATSVDGVVADDHQSNSRVGFTVSWDVRPGHNLRFAVSRGAFTRIGGDFNSVGLAYGYAWAGKP